MLIFSKNKSHPVYFIVLADPMVDNYRVVVCPFIDVIDMNSFELRAQDEGMLWSF